MNERTIQILLVDDDEDSYVITAHLLSMVKGRSCRLDWRSTYEEGLETMARQSHDLYLIDYRLDSRDGLELMRAAMARGCRGPIIMLTGLKDREVDVQAMQAGAADYLVKDRLDPTTLERAIRYAIERHRLNEALAERAERLRGLAGQLSEAEQRERSRVARLLHDHLQQILVSAKMHVESLQGELVDEQRDDVQRLLSQALDVSRTLTVELSPPILLDAGLAAGLNWLARWMHEKYHLHVDAEIDCAAEPAANSVRLMLFHAVRELLFNVTKHARVDRAALSMAPENEHVRITVSDQGRGFDPQILNANPEGRTAFGLVQLRERIQLIGGRLEVDAAPGEGCRITLIAPREPFESLSDDDAPGEQRPLQPGQAPATPALVPATPPIRVMIVDDHPLVRQGLARMLADQSDIEVVAEAADGAQAVELAAQLELDVIIMDIVMPRLNGIEATRIITQQRPNVCIIGMSMYDEPDMARVMHEVGALAYVSKGGPIEKLLSHIRQVAAPARRSA